MCSVFIGPWRNFDASSNLPPEKDEIEMVNDHKQPDQQRVTTEVAGVVTEQPDVVDLTITHTKICSSTIDKK